jgi:hypothetical protein
MIGWNALWSAIALAGAVGTIRDRLGDRRRRRPVRIIDHRGLR